VRGPEQFGTPPVAASAGTASVIALSVFPGLARRAFLATAGAHLADRRTVKMLAAPIPRLSARLERPGLNVWTGQDEMLADPPQCQDSHALNLSALA
jgi:hypothetical protein